MGIKLGMPLPVGRFGIKVPFGMPGHHQPHRELGGSRPMRMTRTHKTRNALTTVKRRSVIFIWLTER